MKRVFLIVLDSVGAGELPDAVDYGDVGCNTLKRISASQKFDIPNLVRLGIGCVDGLSFLGKTKHPAAATARLGELSKGKDTTIGHWEIAGVCSPKPLPTYPSGFPDEILDEIERQTGRGWLCNKPYSGTEVIKDYGDEHIKTGKLIIYTSADSVLQIAAHVDVVPLEELYECCEKVRAVMTGEHGAGRIIARPFAGKSPDFFRTPDRRDYSIKPLSRTILNALSDAGRDVISVGKIKDIFAGDGITEAVSAHGNEEGMAAAEKLLDRDFDGLCFINLVDFDMLYGHRQDIDGYASALTRFDSWLAGFMDKLREGDILMITADHGCDPGDSSTDHTREYVPLLVYGSDIAPIRLGTRASFADIAATIAEWFGVYLETRGKSFAKMLRKGEMSANGSVSDDQLVKMAVKAMGFAYAPYSGHKVGAALLCKNGRVYTGCNIENAAFTPTSCAERTAFCKAVSDGVKEFISIAVVGGKNDRIKGVCAPCGVCRQVMMEFCDPNEFMVILGKENGMEKLTLAQMLPLGFGKDDVK